MWTLNVHLSLVCGAQILIHECYYSFTSLSLTWMTSNICWGIFTSPEKGLVSFRQLTSAGWLTAWPLSAHLTHPLLVSYPLIAIITAVGSCIPQTSASQDNSAISRIVKAVAVGSYSKNWKCMHYVVLRQYIVTAIPYSGKIWQAKNLANCSKSWENQNLANFKFGEFIPTRVNFT